MGDKKKWGKQRRKQYASTSQGSALQMPACQNFLLDRIQPKTEPGGIFNGVAKVLRISKTPNKVQNVFISNPRVHPNLKIQK